MPPAPPASGNSAKSTLDVLEESQQQWLFSEDELQRSPSICDGMPAATEREFRSKGVNFITQVGIMLRLSQTTLGTAAVFFNRFLMRRSLVEKDGLKPLHHYQVAAISVFLATKVEEHVRKIRELVIACCRVAQKNPNLLVDEQTKDFWRWRDSILLNEDTLLELLCFDLTVESPYKILYELIKHYGAAGHSRRAREAAWGFINDSHLTQLCLLFSSRVIACAALYAGCKIAEVALEDEAGEPWWRHQGVKLRDIRCACNYMADWYSKSQVLKPSQGEATYVGLRTPEDADEENAKTRLREGQLPRSLASPAQSTSASVSAMERSESQQSNKRGREDEDFGGERGEIHREEALRVREEDEKNEERESNGQPKPSSRRPQAASQATNGVPPVPWAARAGEPAAKRQRVAEDEAKGHDMALRPPDAGNGVHASPDNADDTAEEGEVEG